MTLRKLFRPSILAGLMVAFVLSVTALNFEAGQKGKVQIQVQKAEATKWQVTIYLTILREWQDPNTHKNMVECGDGTKNNCAVTFVFTTGYTAPTPQPGWRVVYGIVHTGKGLVRTPVAIAPSAVAPLSDL
jgi:hypothetical protein